MSHAALDQAAERAHAIVATLLVPLAIRVLPLDRVLSLCDRWPGHSAARRTGAPPALADRVRRWLGHGRGPWASSCLTRSLVLYAMLRHHGYEPRFHIGVAGKEQQFVAHAWISLDGAPLTDPPAVLGVYRPLLTHRA
jgi:hypothetical protein